MQCDKPVNQKTEGDAKMTGIDRDIAVAEAMQFKFAGWGEPDFKGLNHYFIDQDFAADVRNMLIFIESNLELDDFLMNYAESDRLIDLIWVYHTLKMAIQDPYGGRDQMTQLYIENSLCPIHHCDWAACFDDQDPECEQVRAIYPNSHDT